VDSGTQYFVYEDVESPGSGGNTIAGGNSYFSGGGDFMPGGQALNFALSGTAVPEPSSPIVLASGLLGFGFLQRFRRNG
jgi:PEP-CTERM motif-containing protein